MNAESLIRVRLALDRWFVIVAVVLLALSLFGGWTAYAADSDDPEVRTVDAWSTTAGFDHGAEVREENEVFAVGTVLEDRSAYFTDVTPELEGEFVHQYDADDGAVDVDVDLERVARAVEEVDDEETVEHWSVNESIETTTNEGLEPGEEATAAFAVDVPAMINETERIEESLGSSPGEVETVVVAHVHMIGTIDGEPVERTAEYELEIEPDGDVYVVSGPEEEEYVEERTETVAAADASGPVGSVAGLALSVGSLGALVVLSLAKFSGRLAPSRAARERLRRARERESFDDWISRGSLPEDLNGRSRIAVETLEDLVDVAVDCDRRVIEDGDDYYVLDGDLLYVYTTGVFEDADLESADADGNGKLAEPVTDGGGEDE